MKKISLIVCILLSVFAFAKSSKSGHDGFVTSAHIVNSSSGSINVYVNGGAVSVAAGMSGDILYCPPLPGISTNSVYITTSGSYGISFSDSKGNSGGSAMPDYAYEFEGDGSVTINVWDGVPH